MTITSHLTLKPGPPTAWVCRKFYGGPADGDVTKPIPADALQGTIKFVGGSYSLQGFYSSGHGLPKSIQAVAMDYAVYEWEPRR